jgi:hypothetical protein
LKKSLALVTALENSGVSGARSVGSRRSIERGWYVRPPSFAVSTAPAGVLSEYQPAPNNSLRRRQANPIEPRRWRGKGDIRGPPQEIQRVGAPGGAQVRVASNCLIGARVGMASASSSRTRRRIAAEGCTARHGTRQVCASGVRTRNQPKWVGAATGSEFA